MLAAVAEVRDLARRGVLAQTMQTAHGPLRKRLTGAAYAVAMPVVFNRLTHNLELRRGHPVCAQSVTRLADDCLDRFEDDMEAVVDDIERRANLPIIDLEAWIASRVNKATVDGYRRRRGAVGALQRPRLPAWLNRALEHDRWLGELAIEMLTWAGHPSTAGSEIWPTETWQAWRAQRTDVSAAPGGIHADIAAVLSAMRTRPDWYESFVETPLGHKQPPAAHLSVDDRGVAAEPAPLALVARDEFDDAHLRVMAYHAYEAIRIRTARGEEPRAVVAEVIGTLFGNCDGERVDSLLRDPAELDRIAAEVLAIVELV